MRKIFIASACFVLPFLLSAQHDAAIKEYNKIFTTYPFSDPNPIANPASSIYPYFRYDGFADKPVQKEWKVVELENDFIKLMILPEVGGKVWNAYEKTTGKSFLYDNHVIKFRDVAMRGPWTSGGLEPNYGIIGHTPNCATPVDYITFKKPDGSVSCVVGVLDLLTQTSWRMEINLQKDKAYFTTSSYWYNSTPLEQAYYTWMNTGIKAKGNLEFIFPGTKYLGHEGEFSDWPVNKENSKNISFYENNDFGGYKSYHVFGKYTDFFGAYWHDDAFGMGRYSTHDDKAGKKIWIWGLSQQGMIWDKLLTDTDGQYVEVQSGRLYNQSSEGSTYTPFKHYGFAPYTTDRWTEYWFPVKETHGFVKANSYGALNIKKENGWIKIYFSPLQNIQDEIVIKEGDKEIYRKQVSVPVMKVFADSFKTNADEHNLTVILGNNKMIYQSAPDADVLKRPVQSPAGFDWKSVYGLYVMGKENIQQRHYEEAEKNLKACLAKDPNYAPALNELAGLHYRNMQYEKSLAAAGNSLAINSYDAQANFIYALANLKTGNITDAKDGFDMAALNTSYRSAAFMELAKIYFRENSLQQAAEYAGKSLRNNEDNTDAYQLLALIYRKQKDEHAAKQILEKIKMIDPLTHFADAEKYIWSNTEADKNAMIAAIRNELPEQIYLSQGIWYYNLGCMEEAKKIFAIAPCAGEITYWNAFLNNQPFAEKRCGAVSAFPFHAETADVLQKLVEKNDAWILKYHLALIWWNRNNADKAKQLLQQCGEPNYAPFYATKAMLFIGETEKNLLKAISLDNNAWRYPKLLGEYYMQQQQYVQALHITEPFYKKYPANYIMGMAYAKSLLLNKKYAEADALLTRINIIPFEGATDGRQLYHEAKLMQAVNEMKNGQYKKALVFIDASKLWPENLGVGKPYDDEIDDRLENWMLYLSYTKQGNKNFAQQALEKVLAFTPKRENTVSNYLPASTLITAFAMQKTGRQTEAAELLNNWVKQSPENKTAQWCREVFENNTVQAPAEINGNETVRIIEALMELNK